MLVVNEVLHERYRILRQLGQGGMGAIYVAEDTKRFGKLVALKEILIDLAKHSQKQREIFRRAFEREAKILTGLEHEAFPQVIDYFLETERQFLVMELIQGEDLGEMLEQRRAPFTLKEVLKWTEQLLDALDYLHTLSPPVIHRDIKPQNLKLTKRGKIKLLDFGIASGSDAQIQTAITTNTFIGATWHYSPLEQHIRVLDPNHREFLEQKFGEPLTEIVSSKTDARSDLYSLGATIYHLLTGHPPVDALKRMRESWTGKSDPLPNPTMLNPQISPEMSAWILKAMEIKRENRFSSALEMEKELREAIRKGKPRPTDTERQILLEEHENIKLERELIEQERRHIEAERLIHQQQIENRQRRQSEFDTENLLNPETIKQFQNDWAKEKEPDSTAATTKPVFIKPPPTDYENAATDPEIESLIEDEKNTRRLPHHTASSYLPEDFDESYKDLPKPPITTEEKPVVQPRPPGKVVWILPLSAVAMIMFGGFVLAVWFLMPKTNITPANRIGEMKSTQKVEEAISNNNSTPNSTSSQISQPTIQSNTAANSEKPKPTTAPIQNKTPVQTSKKPSSKPKPTQDPNCVFTNTCQ